MGDLPEPIYSAGMPETQVINQSLVSDTHTSQLRFLYVIYMHASTTVCDRGIPTYGIDYIGCRGCEIIFCYCYVDHDLYFKIRLFVVTVHRGSCGNTASRYSLAC